jgi:hypothetical protein
MSPDLPPSLAIAATSEMLRIVRDVYVSLADDSCPRAACSSADPEVTCISHYHSDIYMSYVLLIS